MVKHMVHLMPPFFTRERFGRPQFLAGALLMAFLVQAIWLLHSELNAPESTATSATEQVRIASGWRQFHGGGIAGAPFPDPNELPIEVSHDPAASTRNTPLCSPS